MIVKKGLKKGFIDASDNENGILKAFLSDEKKAPSGTQSRNNSSFNPKRDVESVDREDSPWMSFDKNADKYVAVGRMLSEARKLKNISLKEIADDVRTRAEFLEMIEEGKYEDVSKITYYYGCVGSFARYLKLDHDKIFDYLLQDDDTYAKMVDVKDSIIRRNGSIRGRPSFASMGANSSFKYMIAMLVLFIFAIGAFSLFSLKRTKDSKQKVSIEELIS